MNIKSTLLTLSLSVFFVSCSKDKEIIQPELVSKTVEFTMVPAADYSTEFYNNATAEVKLSVYKQFDNPYSVSVIWDTMIPKQALKVFMTSPYPQVIKKDIPAYKEDEYKIGAGYNIEYITGPMQSKTWSAFGGVAEYGNTTYKVKVSL